MDNPNIRTLFDFYSSELKHKILPFWLKRCEDKKFGGYLNCFDNRGEKLINYDKYTWSQGRFLWLFSRLAVTEADLFSESERDEFKRLAKTGYGFLRAHCLMEGEPERCIFLLCRDGSPKFVEGYNTLDMSIYADCFVVIGMAAYSIALDDEEAYLFSRKLYDSIKRRVESDVFNTLPYPLDPSLHAHGIPMIMTNVAKELYLAAVVFDEGKVEQLLCDMERTSREVLENFTDDQFRIHEVITKENEPVLTLLGQHMNPGHSIEDSWFIFDAAMLLKNPELAEKGAIIMKTAFNYGWDEEYGGVLHFVNLNGDRKTLESTDTDPTTISVTTGWGDKLWWVHSETLYASLLYWLYTGDCEYKKIHDKAHRYIFGHFPNPDQRIGEWIQILTREGLPQDKVVALPVKDPFHIIRNLLMICELLANRE